MLSAPKDDARFEAAKAILECLTQAGYESYLAGGCVRDLLMGRRPRDYDIATAARPEDIRRLFPNALETGAAFGVFRVAENQHEFEIASFRRDIGSLDGRHPRSVEFGSAQTDAQRRDFTINGMFFDPINRRLLDMVGGETDIRNKIVRAIGIPEQRFDEDYLRMLRAVRFAATLEFDIEIQTLEAIRRLAPNIGKISAERTQYELTVMLTEAPKAGQGLRHLRESGLLSVLLPEVAAMAAVTQPAAYHPEGDVFEHTALMLDLMPFPRAAELVYSVLLHDVGKPPSKTWRNDGTGQPEPFFPEHAETGAALAENILRRLRCPNRLIQTVTRCVKNHMRFMHVREMRPSKLRAWVAQPEFPIELELHRLDCLASHRDLSNYKFVRDFIESLKHKRQLPAPWVTGDDIKQLGVPEGPEVGRFHRMAYDAQLDGRFVDRAALLEWIKQEAAQAGFTPNPQ
jgi:poly(A) polymerase